MAVNERDLVVDVGEGRLLASFLSSGTRVLSPFYSGDKLKLNLRLVQKRAGGGRLPWEDIDLSGASVKVALGKIGEPPTAGTWTLRDPDTEATSGTLTVGKRYEIVTFESGDDFANVGASSNAAGVVFTATGTTPTTWSNGSALQEISADLDHDITAADLQSELRDALSNYSSCVVSGGDGGPYSVNMGAVGTRTAPVSDADALQPDSLAVVSTSQTGTSSVKAIFRVELFQQPAAQNTSWSALPSASATVTELVKGASGVNEKQRVAIGGEPYAGSFTLTATIGGTTETTEEIAYNATAADVKEALEGLSTIAADEVSVSKPADGTPTWDVQFRGTLAATDIAAMTVDTSALSVPSGLTGTLDLNTDGVVRLLADAGEESVEVTFEIEVTPSGGSPYTALQTRATLVRDLIDPNSAVPTPRDSYYTSPVSDLRYVRYLGDGALADVQALDTAGGAIADGSSVSIYVTSREEYMVYELVAGTDAANSPLILRPDDYAASTNERVWKLRGVSKDNSLTLDDIGNGPSAAAGSTPSNITVSAGGGGDGGAGNGGDGGSLKWSGGVGGTGGASGGGGACTIEGGAGAEGSAAVNGGHGGTAVVDGGAGGAADDGDGGSGGRSLITSGAGGDAAGSGDGGAGGRVDIVGGDGGSGASGGDGGGIYLKPGSPLSGVEATVRLYNAAALLAGATDYLSLYHDGSDAHLTTPTGEGLNLNTTDDIIRLQRATVTKFTVDDNPKFFADILPGLDGSYSVGSDALRISSLFGRKKLELKQSVDLGAASADCAYMQAEEIGGSAELVVEDEAGNRTTISPHPEDAPEELYDRGVGLDNITKERQRYLGIVRWTHNDRIAAQVGMTDAEKAALSVDKRVTVLEESFAEYNARRGLAKGDAGYLEAEDWDQVQARHAAAHAAEQEKRRAAQAAWDKKAAELAAQEQRFARYKEERREHAAAVLQAKRQTAQWKKQHPLLWKLGRRPDVAMPEAPERVGPPGRNPDARPELLPDFQRKPKPGFLAGRGGEGKGKPE